MGRIADALKRAEQERSLRMRLDDGGARALNGGNLEPVAPAEAAAAQDLRLLDAPAIHPRNGARRAAPPLTPPPPWDVHSTVVAVCDRESPITEQYRSARTWILRRQSSGRQHCIAVTSSMPREGKSVTTANLAAVFAEIRHLNVLAVDCDFRQGSLARLYKLPNTPGLSDVLAGRARLADAIMRTPIGNFSLLPAGTCLDLTPAELLNSSRAARVFDEIRERYPVVLVDTPPVQPMSDVGAIGAFCTGIVMVVRMNKTPGHVVRKAVHWLQSNNLTVLGCIAADCSAKGVRYEYEDDDED